MGHRLLTPGRSVTVLGVVIQITLFSIAATSISSHPSDVNHIMSRDEREELKEEARDMFYHAYRAYMENAYPADELMPLSCGGRYRGLGPSRGDIDDCLGNFSLTLVDTLDTLVVLGDLEEFEHAVSLVIKDVSFDTDIVVSVFETNIRMLGGLLSAHILAEYLQQRAGILQWYRGELLSMAKDLGFRLLPAFNTSTGIPHARVNLRHGLKSPLLEDSRETCTACAGTMVLEMAALSRLSGEAIFEEKAHRAMDVLWQMRHRSSDLMGTVLNVHSGDWVRRDSGVGAGIDSYYEYCLKAYILLGDERYLGRFNKHYSAVMKYISQGPMLLDVLMHRPHTNSRNFMDALLAFWPGLQVLKGDLRPAVETHEMLYQVMQRHNFIPEAFTTDFQVHWGQHPLRPEFLESTYFLYRATQDPYYLQVGKHALRSLQTYARVPCGYAAVKDVRTSAHEDRMDSFVLAETFKYLFLLFADPSELMLDLDEFLFTTEAHLLPLSLARRSNISSFASPTHDTQRDADDVQFSRACPNTLHLFPESVRRPLKNMVNGVCPRRSTRRKLHALQFQIGNPEHMKAVRDMGIAIITLPDGRLQLLHTFASARSPGDAEEGLQFMQEMVELSRSQSQTPDSAPLTVSFALLPPGSAVEQRVSLNAGPAHFGREIRGDEKVTARVAITEPLKVCEPLLYPERLNGKIAVMERGDCMFIEKARRVERAGAVAALVLDNTSGSSAANSPMFAMSGDGTNDVNIPLAFLFQQDAFRLLQALALDPSLLVTISDASPDERKKLHHQGLSTETESLVSEASGVMESRLLENILEKLKGSVRDFLIKESPSKSGEAEQDDPGRIRTSSPKNGRSRGRGQGGVGGAQDGDGLGSSVREHLGSAGVPTVEGDRIFVPGLEPGTLQPPIDLEVDEGLSKLQYEAKLRQLMSMLAMHAPDTPDKDSQAIKQLPKFSELLDNILNNDLNGMDNLVDKMREKVRVFKINDIIEELEENPGGAGGELKRGIVELLERKQSSPQPSTSGAAVISEPSSLDNWKPISLETVEGVFKASHEQKQKQAPEGPSHKAVDEL